jgi:hypothetical protein
MDGSESELKIARKLGFDDNFLVYIGQKGAWGNVPLYPAFEEKIVGCNFFLGAERESMI